MNTPVNLLSAVTIMRKSTLTIAMATAIAALFSGCNSLERSRSLSNPAVTATVIAQQVCSNCHGVTGNAESPNFPNLAAQSETYFIAQLNGFKNHRRHDPAGFEYMWGLSKDLTDVQIVGLAAYYAKQKPKKISTASSDTTLVAEGKKIFAEGIAASQIPACSACHGADAQGQAAFPRLSGQHADYLVKQLMVFQRTDERPEGSVMKGIAHLLTPQNMAAVASYLEGLPSK